MTSLNLQPFNPIQKLYSSDYEGEWINVELNKDRSDRRFIKPSITFNNPGGNAICLGNGKSRSVYSLKQLESSNKRKILRYYNVVYGCNGLFREWHPDFLVLTNLALSTKLPEELYSITFAPQEIMRRYAGMNLIPGVQRHDAGSVAAYLAAFHGAKRIFLFGYDGQQDAGYNNNIYAGTEYYPDEKEEIKDSLWSFNLKTIIRTYDDVEFFRITTNPEDSYRFLLRFGNYKPINFKKFITLADL